MTIKDEVSCTATGPTSSHGISRCRFVGTHTGEFQGRTPTGKKVSIAVIHIDRFQGDTVVGHRAQMDMHGLLAQLDAD